MIFNRDVLIKQIKFHKLLLYKRIYMTQEWIHISTFLFYVREYTWHKSGSMIKWIPGHIALACPPFLPPFRKDHNQNSHSHLLKKYKCIFNVKSKCDILYTVGYYYECPMHDTWCLWAKAWHKSRYMAIPQNMQVIMCVRWENKLCVTEHD